MRERIFPFFVGTAHPSAYIGRSAEESPSSEPLGAPRSECDEALGMKRDEAEPLRATQSKSAMDGSDAGAT